MHWFKQYDDPQPPQTFLDKFYAGRDDPKQVSWSLEDGAADRQRALRALRALLVMWKRSGE
jgi:hypothetical protein